MSLEKIVANLVQKVENRFYGKYRGLVVENADPEKLGRLKVRVPSVLGNDIVTGWAMPCVPYGGDRDQGFLFIPEVGAGVWVEFEEGDLEFPIWVGTFWSKPDGESELPKVNDEIQDPPTQKVIKTKKGHTIQLEDADGEEKIVIKHKDNSFISIDKDGSVLLSNNNGSLIILNSKDKNAAFLEEHGHMVSMTEAGVQIVNKEGSAVLLQSDMVRVTAKTVAIQGSTVVSGEGAQFPTIVVDPTFQTMWNLFATTHTHATAVGPSGPPLPLGPQLLPGNGLTSAVLVK